MTTHPDLAVGELQAALSQAVSRILAEFYGKGPARTRTYVFDDYIFAVCDDVLTTAERALRAAGDEELVRDVRVSFEDLMTRAFVSEVEKLTGRTVVGYHSQILVDHGSAFEVFVLDPTQPGVASRTEPEAEVLDAAQQPVGEPGDADALPAPGERPAPTERRDAPRPRAPHGQLRAAIGNALVRVVHEFHGRGPARARVYLADEYVFCALEDPLTTVERTLTAGGRMDLVRRLRSRLLVAARDQYAYEVEQVVGRRVLACDAQVVFEPDVVFLTFVVDGAAAGDGPIAGDGPSGDGR